MFGIGMTVKEKGKDGPIMKILTTPDEERAIGDKKKRVGKYICLWKENGNTKLGMFEEYQLWLASGNKPS